MRYRRDSLTTIKRPHGPGLVLARRYPGDEHLRALAVEDWGHASYSPRQQLEPGIDIPISAREQVGYEASLRRGVRAALNGLSPILSRSRVHLDVRHANIATRHPGPIDTVSSTRVRSANGMLPPLARR